VGFADKAGARRAAALMLGGSTHGAGSPGRPPAGPRFPRRPSAALRALTDSSRRSFSSSAFSPVVTRSTSERWQVGTTSRSAAPFMLGKMDAS
jgi:hypothetical protein